MCITLHTVLCHLEPQGTYAQQLFVIYSSAFNTITLNKLFSKMPSLRMHHICLWNKELLKNWPQSVRMGSHYSSTLTLKHGSPTRLYAEPVPILKLYS